VSEPVWQRGDLLGVAELSTAEILHVLDTAESFVEVAARPIKKVPTLRGKTVINLFFEASTRTSSSFEIAEKRLSADNINFSTSSSSLSKGETLLDTARNLEAMAPDLVVIRHAHPRVPDDDEIRRHRLQVAGRVQQRFALGQGRGGSREVDVVRRKGRVEGLKIAIVGDVAHSRVVRSNVLCLTKLGADVTVAGPRTMMPEEPESLGARVAYSLEEAIEAADVVMMLRVQLERQARASFPSEREYFEFFGLTAERLRGAQDDAIIMHPGPINRGIEIASEVADGPWSVILEQVANGVAVRMAVLYLLAGAKSGADGTMP